MKTRIGVPVALAAALALIVSVPDEAHPAAGPVVSGKGWKISAPRITHIDTKPWQIAFHDPASRAKLTPYLRQTAAELTSRLGVRFTVTTRIVRITRGKCVTGHTISLRYMSKPDAANPDHPNQSITGSCGNSQHTAIGAYILINSDYWKPGSRIPEPVRRNVIWHEMAHAVGLSHPAACPKDKYGIRPLMCGTRAGGYNHLRPRRYTTWEHTGFRQLVANRAYAR